ncbi:hypothetical protein LAZ67_20000111 [Cordylochernes scorpioides]|uniref:Uncharacterized protein n=1 Tax=Cordylochernes scorpioides TaxID=51811 RepID=A0ABY6LLR0_9ARAC|nr:hypothetical protein LAZ67_20000111 [Cordylochernes scorpioides]
MSGPGSRGDALHCHNLSRILDLLQQQMMPNTTADDSAAEDDDQKNAVIYIVVVLLFYSFGIGVMMIKYMRKEEKEQEECKMYRRYINSAHEQYLHSTNRARLANRLALQALNTVNAIPQTTQLGSKVTFV